MTPEIAMEHRQVTELLPWFVNQTLDEPELTRVRQHLNSCLLCRKDLEYQRRLCQAIREPDNIDQASRQGFAALMQRIDTRERVAQRPWLSAAMRRFSRPRQLIRASHPLLRGALAAQALIITIGVAMWPSSLDQHVPLYRTLTATDNAAESRLDRFRVVFSDNISEKALRGLISEINGAIVAGPSAAGVYTIEVLPASGSDNHARVLQRLRADDRVQFAERVHAQ